MHSVTKEFLLRKAGFALLAAEEQPFLTTHHRHTTVEQILQVGSVVPILLLLKGLCDENFAIVITPMNVNLTLMKFQFGTAARFLFTNHQIWHSVIYGFAQVCIYLIKAGIVSFRLYNNIILSAYMVCKLAYIPVILITKIKGKEHWRSRKHTFFYLSKSIMDERQSRERSKNENKRLK